MLIALPPAPDMVLFSICGACEAAALEAPAGARILLRLHGQADAHVLGPGEKSAQTLPGLGQSLRLLRAKGLHVALAQDVGTVRTYAGGLQSQATACFSRSFFCLFACASALPFGERAEATSFASQERVVPVTQ